MKRSINLLIISIMTIGFGFAQNAKIPLKNIKKIKIQASSDIRITNGEFSYLILDDDNNMDKVNYSDNGTLILSFINSTIYLGKDAQIESLSIDGASEVVFDPKLDSSVFAKNFILKLSGASEFNGKLSCLGLIIHNSGASDVVTNIRCDSLYILNDGSSALDISGSALSGKIDVSGVSSIEGKNLKVSNLNIKLSGSSFGSIYADTININVSGFSEFVPTNKDAYILGYLNSNPDFDAISKNTKKIVTDEILKYENGVKEYSDKVDSWGKKYKKLTSRRNFSGHWMGVELGFNNYSTVKGGLQPSFNQGDSYSPMELNFSKSISFAWNIFQYSVGFTPNFGLVTGVGIVWNNYRFNDDQTRIGVENGKAVASLEASPTIYGVKSKLNVNWVRIPLLLEYNYDNFHVSAGIIGNLKIGNSLVVKYHEQGVSGKQKDKSKKDIYINPLRADLALNIGFNCFSIYGKYALTPMFANHKGPELTPFEIGISLLF